MRLTNPLLCALVVVIGASGVLAVGREKQILRRLHDQQLAIEALGRAVGETRAEQRRYFEALGLAVGQARNQESKLWPAIEGRLGDLDTADAAQRNDLTALAASLGVKHGPRDIDIGSLDNYDELDQNWKSFRDHSQRTQVPCRADERTAVIVTLGQSNAANYALRRYTPKHDVLNFDLYDGRCYKARDPLLGTSGTGGNFATPLADMLIDRGLYARVIIAPIAMGGSTVEEWADQGVFNRRILVLMRRLFDAGLTPTQILWHQGEGNSGLRDSRGRQYRKNLLEVIATFRTYGNSAPFFVALATKCGPYPRLGGDNIRDGQASAVNPLENVFLGPDTDTLGDEYRDKEHCHFNAAGLPMHAAMWADVVQAWAHFQKLARREAVER
jgi:Carbohydrate esterase, sialic acid-specific acetylesterase